MAASLFASAGLSSVVDPFLVQLDALSPHAVPVLKFFLLFTLVYKLGKSTAPARLSVADTGYWGSSVTSTVHGFIVTYLGWVGCRDAQLFTTTDLYKTTPSTELACQCFLGYILQDTFTLFTYLKEWKGSTPYVFHHISAAYAWGLCLRFGVAQLMTCPLLLCEATALFTNARWVFSILGGAWRNGPIYLVNGLLMYVSFFALRVCMMGWLVSHALRPSPSSAAPPSSLPPPSSAPDAPLRTHALLTSGRGTTSCTSCAPSPRGCRPSSSTRSPSTGRSGGLCSSSGSRP